MNWRPISEAWLIVKDGGRIHVLFASGRESDCVWDATHKTWADQQCLIFENATHFMLVTPPGEQQQPESVNQRLLDAAENYCIVERDLYDAVGSSETERILKLHKQEKASRQELYAAIDAAKQAKQ